MKRNIKYLFLLLAAVLTTACERNFINPESNKLTKDVLYDVMNEWYLWYDQMPAVNPGDYSSLSELLDALRLEPTDKWSYVVSTEEYDRFYDQNEYIGHGFGLKWDEEGRLRISFTFDGTSAGSQGVERGWEILGINGESITLESNIDSLLGADSVGVQNAFSFRDNLGQSVNLNLTKEIVDINTVLHSEIIDLDGSKVGYFVYQQFLSNSVTELDDVFGSFVDNDVDEVVVDLRYNGGGQVDAARHLGSLLAGEFAIKRTFVSYEYNDKKASSFDRDITYLELDDMLDPTPDRIFFITTGASASASELVINSLLGLTGLNRPLDIYLVGDDTYGKPVGAIGFRYSDTTLVPIAFRYTNRLGEGGFFDGLPADSYIQEDLSIDFGDPEEKLLKEVLYFIENGEFTGAGKKKAERMPSVKLKGIRSEIGAI